MHMRLRAPLLSAACSMVRIWIMSLLLLPGSDRCGALDDPHQAPGLARRQAAALRDVDDIAFLALAGLVMRHQLGRAAHVLAVAAVLHEALDGDRDGLLHLVADDGAGHGAFRAFGRCLLARCLA